MGAVVEIWFESLIPFLLKDSHIVQWSQRPWRSRSWSFLCTHTPLRGSSTFPQRFASSIPTGNKFQRCGWWAGELGETRRWQEAKAGRRPSWSLWNLQPATTLIYTRNVPSRHLPMWALLCCGFVRETSQTSQQALRNHSSSMTQCQDEFRNLAECVIKILTDFENLRDNLGHNK